MIITVASNNNKYMSDGCSNYNYLNNVIPFVKSAAKFCPNIKLQINLINSKEYDIDILKQLHPNIEITFSIVYGNKNTILLESAFKRSRMMKYAIKNKENKFVMWIDSDTIIRKPIGDIINNIVNYQEPVLSLRYRPDLSDNLKFLGSLIIMNNNIVNEELCEIWSNLLSSGNKWLDDQKYLWQAYNIITANKSLNLLNMPMEYCDERFGDDSYIWHCKGGFDKPKWIKETKKYG